MKDFRGVTLTSSLFDSVGEEVEGKELIPPNQAGFRKGMGTMDNVYVLNYLLNRQVEKGVGYWCYFL